MKSAFIQLFFLASFVFAIRTVSMEQEIINYKITRDWVAIDCIEMTRIELEDGLKNAEHKNGKGFSMLSEAVEYDELNDITQKLLSDGVKFMPSATGKDQLHHAIECNSFGAAQILLNHGADAKSSLLPLMERVIYTQTNELFNAQKKLFEILLKHHADVNAHNELNETPLMKIVQVGLLPGLGTISRCKIPAENRLHFVCSLLGHGAYTSEKNNDGKTTLDIAKENGFDFFSVDGHNE